MNQVPRSSRIGSIVLVAVALLAGPVACDVGGGGTGDGEELSPRELGRLGGRIHVEPERRDEILADAGLSAEELEELVREVTADPEASRAYAEGFRQAAGEPSDGS
ncbi:MAG TPA: hypothetical protein VM617_04090 [Thermoanaerobaculia bacterium]|nr:hypothetical protein [Thermoanaerobaculia bacterium]